MAHWVCSGPLFQSFRQTIWLQLCPAPPNADFVISAQFRLQWVSLTPQPPCGSTSQSCPASRGRGAQTVKKTTAKKVGPQKSTRVAPCPSPHWWDQVTAISVTSQPPNCIGTPYLLGCCRMAISAARSYKIPARAEAHANPSGPSGLERPTLASASPATAAENASRTVKHGFCRFDPFWAV